MNRFRSLLIDRAKIRMPGMTVRTLAVHRHLREHASVAPHVHGWHQLLLYLGGQGIQVVGEQRLRVTEGSLVVVSAGLPHAFERTGSRTPLCLMIDFEFATGGAPGTGCHRLSAAELVEVRQTLAALMSLAREETRESLVVQGAPLVLQVLTSLLRKAGWLRSGARSSGRRTGSTLRVLLQRMDVSAPLQATIARSGYQRDHLNRLLRRETGLSLGQHRARQRLARAQALLRQGVSVAAAAESIGLPDAGYFSRWFRRQTGVTPTAWAAGAPTKER